MFLGFGFERGSSVVHTDLEFSSLLSLLIMHRLPRVLYSYFVVGLFLVLSLEVSHALQDVLVEVNRSRTPGISVSFSRRWDKAFRNHCPIFINQGV